MGLFRLTLGAALATLLSIPVCEGFSQTVTAGSQRDQPITLDQAIARAMVNEPAFAAVRAEKNSLALERTNARTALLPTATYHNQALYTQPNGVPTSRIGQTTNAPSPIFIANNAVHEYASLGVFNETLGLAQVGAIRLADANAARAAAELEVARRGLVTTVVMLYYAVNAGQEKVTVSQQALAEASHFTDITRKREASRESAHADVLKAELLEQQRQREQADAELAFDKARLELAVLLFPDPKIEYSLVHDAGLPPLPALDDVNRLAGSRNPELQSALASFRASQAETYTARAALLPDLLLNFTYGIDATNFGLRGPDGIHNLGYSLSAQLDIPVWDWLSSERKIKESRLREQAAHVALSSTQRRLIANLQEFYAEANASNRQLASLDTSVETARESLRLTELRYENGEGTVLEVVDAQSALTAAENARIDGKVRYQVALANLQTLTGSL